MKILGAFLLGVLFGAAGLWLLADATASGAGHLSRHRRAARAAKRRAWERAIYAVAR